MGAVFEARHTSIGRRCAVKMLLPERPAAIQRFEREAKAAAALENEHIVSVIDFGTAASGAPYLVMELLVGTSLRDILSTTRQLSTERTIHLARQACLGLRDAHAHGIVHRDLKPENLFVGHRSTGEEQLKILDFGIAKLQATTRATLETRPGRLLGTC
jgi:serine/threonine-protein kinase